MSPHGWDRALSGALQLGRGLWGAGGCPPTGGLSPLSSRATRNPSDTGPPRPAQGRNPSSPREGKKHRGRGEMPTPWHRPPRGHPPRLPPSPLSRSPSPRGSVSPPRCPAWWQVGRPLPGQPFPSPITSPHASALLLAGAGLPWRATRSPSASTCSPTAGTGQAPRPPPSAPPPPPSLSRSPSPAPGTSWSGPSSTPCSATPSAWASWRSSTPLR